MKSLMKITLIAACVLPALLLGSIQIRRIRSAPSAAFLNPCAARKLAVDTLGGIHICLVKGNLQDPCGQDTVMYLHSYNDGITWDSTMVTRTFGEGAIAGTSIAVKPNGIPFITTAPGNVWSNGTLRTYPIDKDPSTQWSQNYASISVHPYSNYGIMYATEVISAELSKVHTWVFRLDNLDLVRYTVSDCRAMNFPSSTPVWGSDGTDPGNFFYDFACVGLIGTTEQGIIIRKIDYGPLYDVPSDFHATDEDDPNRQALLHSYPSVTSLCGDHILAVYWDPISPPSIRCRSLPNREHPDCWHGIYQPFYPPGYERGDLISEDGGAFGGGKALQVSLQSPHANPLYELYGLQKVVVVWEYVTSPPLMHKIKFRFGDFIRYIPHPAPDDPYPAQEPSLYRDFQGPVRLTNSGPDVHEWDPHVAYDAKHNKAYVLYDRDSSFNGTRYYSLMLATIDFSTGIIITRPEGGEQWPLLSTEKVKWVILTDNHPDSIRLECKPDYSRPWFSMTTSALSGSTREYDWTVGEYCTYWLPVPSYNSLIRAIAYYPGGVIVADTSEPFTILPAGGGGPQSDGSVTTPFCLNPPSVEASGATSISFSIPQACNVNLDVYNVSGQKVKTLLSGEQPQGTHQVTWEDVDNAGRSVSAGVYFIRMETPSYQANKKITILR